MWAGVARTLSWNNFSLFRDENIVYIFDEKKQLKIEICRAIQLKIKIWRVLWHAVLRFVESKLLENEKLAIKKLAPCILKIFDGKKLLTIEIWHENINRNIKYLERKTFKVENPEFYNELYTWRTFQILGDLRQKIFESKFDAKKTNWHTQVILNIQIKYRNLTKKKKLKM